MRTPPVYIPRHGSLADRVLEWFRRNPDERLSRADVSIKFEVSRASVGACLQPLIAAGELAWEQRDGMVGSYYLPEQLTAARQTPDPQPAAEPLPATVWRSSASTDDLHATVNADRRLHIAFTIPPEADPNLVMAAMLIAAAESTKARP